MSRVNTLRAAAVLAALLVAAPAAAQHDRERNAVQQIARGRFDAAAKELAGRGATSGEAETDFVEMLALLAQDDPDDTAIAVKKAREAVAAGLPFSRLLAGPRPWLKKLHGRDDFRRWKAEVNPAPLVHGPMLGAMRDSGVSVWARTDGPCEIAVQIDGRPGRVTAQTNDADDFTAVLVIDGLSPDTEYSYRVTIDGQPVALEGIETKFRTYPEQGKPAKFSIGFGGGAGYVPEWERMWDTIRERRPAAFLMLGDNVYVDDPEHAVTQQYCYTRRQGRPEWRRFTALTPIYAIYDDHDFGDNDCIPGPHIERPPWKRQLWSMFRRNWANPAYGGGEKQPGCWHDFRIADVHFILLDGRYYRDLKGGSMLGPVQKAWLFETLKASDATFKVIASPVPFTAGVKPGSRDPWDGYPEEREEIFRFFETEAIEGVFLIAADRHRTDLRITRRPAGYDLYEFESSKLTNRHTHGAARTEGLVWGYNKTCSFGLVTFDTTADDPQASFKAVTIDGETVESFVLKRSRLQREP